MSEKKKGKTHPIKVSFRDVGLDVGGKVEQKLEPENSLISNFVRKKRFSQVEFTLVPFLFGSSAKESKHHFYSDREVQNFSQKI